MATFEGTVTEFKRYFGPRLRNLVQQIAKGPKATTGACEHCGADGTLEAAHVHGRERMQIIDAILGQSEPTSVVTVNLERFETSFRFEHEPIEKAFLILCHQCHQDYDRSSHRRDSTKKGPLSAPNKTQDGILPFTFDPSPADEFKKALLRSKSAEFEMFYSDGRVEHKRWNASRFNESANLMGNLRSRPEFRKGAWQSAGLVKVHVRVLPHP